jgi:signal transduction histidine kinase
VFEPFTQVDRQRDTALGGVGLGLTLVKWLVELHSGTVTGAQRRARTRQRVRRDLASGEDRTESTL